MAQASHRAAAALVLGVGLGAGLGACSPVLVPIVAPIPVILPAPGAPTQQDACGALALSPALGRPVAAVALPEDRPVRVIRPGDLVTQDFAPVRLNVELDARDRIARLRCG